MTIYPLGASNAILDIETCRLLCGIYSNSTTSPMKVEQFKKIVGITLLIVFIGGAIYKIGENSDSILINLFISLIMLFVAWGVYRLLSEY